MNRIRELDGLRAVAILLVLGCHYEGFAALLGGAPEFGWIGVELFFVLSGYLITTILLGLRDKPQPYKTFYSRRMVRIFPPYFAITLIVILLHVISRSSPRPDWAHFLAAQFLFLQAYYPDYGRFFASIMTHGPHLPGLLQNAHRLPAILPGLPPSFRSAFETYWSLSIEEYFYLLWAPIVLRCRPRTIVFTAAFVCIAESLLRWSYADHLAYYGLFFRFDALMYGAILAMLLRRWKPVVPRIAARAFGLTLCASIAGLLLIFLLIGPILGYEIRQSPLMLAFGLPLISIASASLIGTLVFAADSSAWAARLMRSGPMQYVGTISYTMYLVHVLAAAIVYGVLASIAPYIHHGLRLWEAVLSSALTIAIARISWLYLERPLLRWKDKRFPAARARIAAGDVVPA
jgi:peptidoglycan/LPS O-acetylase OafA/YrhL